MTPILDDAAARQLDALAADPRPGAHVGIVAPGGYGKTTLLHHLGAVIRATGTPVHTVPPFEDATDGVLLVDDAHLLDDADLARLRDLATTTRLIVAARPWPRSAALSELLDLAQDQLLPAPFDQAPGPCVPAGRTPHRRARRVRAHRDRRRAGVRRPPGADAGRAAARGAGRGARRVPRRVRQARRRRAAVHARRRRRRRPAPRPAGGPAGPGRDRRSPTSSRRRGRPGSSARPARCCRSPAARSARWSRSSGARGCASGSPSCSWPAAVRCSRWSGRCSAPASAARRAATAFEAAAEEALPVDPALAARLYEAAVTAGRPPLEVGARRAEALALAGDLDGALRLADEVITTEAAAGPPARGRGRRGGARAPRPARPQRAAVPVVGDRRGASTSPRSGCSASASWPTRGSCVPRSTSDGPPTSLSSAITLMARRHARVGDRHADHRAVDDGPRRRHARTGRQGRAAAGQPGRARRAARTALRRAGHRDLAAGPGRRGRHRRRAARDPPPAAAHVDHHGARQPDRPRPSSSPRCAAHTSSRGTGCSPWPSSLAWRGAPATRTHSAARGCRPARRCCATPWTCSRSCRSAS